MIPCGFLLRRKQKNSGQEQKMQIPAPLISLEHLCCSTSCAIPTAAMITMHQLAAGIQWDQFSMSLSLLTEFREKKKKHKTKQTKKTNPHK